MSTRKKFGRAIVFEAEEKNPGGKIVRVINAPREGGVLEGAYASVSSLEAVRLQPYETQRRSLISDSVKTWFSIVLFWISLCFFASTFWTAY